MNVFITIGSEEASDAWGFVGTVHVGDDTAFRTLTAYTTPSQAADAAQRLLCGVLGELLAAREWSQTRDANGTSPRRIDFAMAEPRLRRVDD